MKELLLINNVGGMEVILILFFVLMFFGAKSIPGLAKTLGRGIREIQHASDEIKREIRSTGETIKNDFQAGNEINQIVQNIENQPRQLLDQIEQAVELPTIQDDSLSSESNNLEESTPLKP